MTDAKNHWFKFYPSDWRSDPALRICSLAARGLWAECMCLMHEAKPYGHLLVNGRPVTDTQLAALIGIPVDQLTALLGELENAGVFSKRGDGVIYSRRMTRDSRRAAINKKNGKSGGNPRLVNPPDNPSDKPSLHLEARSQKLDINPKRDSSDLVGSLSRTLKNQKDWTPEQRKAAWLSNICKELERTLTPDKYGYWLEAYMAGDKTARELAEQIDRKLKSQRLAQGAA